MSVTPDESAADLMNVAASLARLSFFHGEDADKISHQSHDNIIMLAQRAKRDRDALVATVEARDTQLADAHAVIRCLLSGFRPHHRGEDHWCRNPFGSGHEHDARAYPMTPGEVAAITAARATEGAGGE